MQITIIEKHQIAYIHPEDVLFIRKGTMPIDLRIEYVEVHLRYGRIEIDDMKVKEFHNLLSSGKIHEIKKVFRRLE
jgi:hypothetical protein